MSGLLGLSQKGTSGSFLRELLPQSGGGSEPRRSESERSKNPPPEPPKTLPSGLRPKMPPEEERSL
ncbi:hypothetical protein OUY22_30760 [Nonomuraea sp. MCN248]|uniref:Uncharacterized protein n=1 Tax=Nonomuraea corallina TaxID=2989783 RepID=A0ABT4SKS7_9ACTN|nr:hypothetical protein [Nonomuraea corallina]MDA0637813.1 hypothetical protein [Nonomuraea corallina]